MLSWFERNLRPVLREGEFPRNDDERGIPPAAQPCIPVCVKAGGAFVLVDAAAKPIYELYDRQKPARFAEQDDTIHVTAIQPGK